MKQLITLISLLSFSLSLIAQEKMYIHKKDGITLGAWISQTDSVYFSNSGNMISFHVNGQTASYALSDLDSISFDASSNIVQIHYTGDKAYIINPYAFEGVSVSVSDEDVTVTSTADIANIEYQLLGTTTDGSFKIYSDKAITLELNGVSMANSDGPAVNIQTAKKTTVNIMNGTSSTLADGSSYATSTEDQKATLFSEGQLKFEGTGSLSILSKASHGICSDDYIGITSGNIVITSAAKDGVHTNDYFSMSGGSLNITATGDGIQCDGGYILITEGSITTSQTSADVKALTCDSIMTINGGTLNLTLSGNQSKGLKSGQNMYLNGGTIVIKNTGNAVLEASGSGYDPSYGTGIKCDSTVTVSGAEIQITTTGTGGKGISSDKNLIISSGTVVITNSGNGASYKNSSGTTDGYSSTGLSTDGNLSILGGTVSLTNSGTGGRGISSDGSLNIGDAGNSPVLGITTTGSKITLSGSGNSATYLEAKAVKCDGAVTLINGNTTISSADDGIKTETSTTIKGGTLNITKAIEGLEGPLITVNGGYVSIVASDDGFNATKGNGGESNDGSLLTFTGGSVYIDASGGDGLDSNGSITMSGGTVAVHGAQSSPEVGLDYNGTCNLSGGLLVVSGISSNMTQGASASSTQYSIKATTTSTISAGTIFHIQDASGTDLLTFKPSRAYSSVIFSSASLKSGSTYYLYTGGTSTGTAINGLYSGGSYSNGTQKKSFTVSGTVTTVTF